MFVREVVTDYEFQFIWWIHEIDGQHSVTWSQRKERNWPKREGHNSKLPIDLWFCKLPRSELSIHWPKPSLMYAVSVCWPFSYSPQTMLSINWINWINQCRCASLRRLISFSSVRSFRPASHHQTNPIQSVSLNGSEWVLNVQPHCVTSYNLNI